MLQNIRFYILILTAVLAAGIFFYIKITTPSETLQIIQLTQIYALLAVGYLYLAMMATPVTRIFTFLPFRGQYLKARRAIGVSAFLFGVLHGSLAFFGELGGFYGLGFLSTNYLLGIVASSVALLILSLMAATSFDWLVTKLTFPKWKLLHRFVYLAGILIIFHALLLGSHFADLSGLIPQIFFVALAILLILESIRADNYLSQKLNLIPKFGIIVLIIVMIVMIFLSIF